MDTKCQSDVDTGTWVAIHCNHLFFSQIINNIFLKLKQIYANILNVANSRKTHIKTGRCAFVGVVLRYQCEWVTGSTFFMFIAMNDYLNNLVLAIYQNERVEANSKYI